MGRWLLAALFLLLALGFLGLGVWQVERRTWKLDLIARVDARVHAPPQPMPPRAEWPRIDDRTYAYRHVEARGVFLHDRETLVQAVTDLGPGWWVLTPFRTGGTVVLVNRGFVPPKRRGPRARGGNPPDQVVAVTGLLRISEPGGGFLRANNPAAGRWYSRDVAAIAHARGLADVAPFFVDADATPNPGGYPVGGLTTIAFRNSHLVYAITWFSLAALTICGLAILLRDRPTR